MARRLFECTPVERRELWEPIVGLPFAAHHHICYFLDQLLIESLRTEPYLIAELIPIWHDIAEKVFTSLTSNDVSWRDRIEVQKHVLLH